MGFRRGALLDPRSRDYYSVALVVETVKRLTGQRSRWNSRVYFELSGADGAAGPDGGMAVSDAAVLQPLRRALAGEDLTADELTSLRDALVTLTHESFHLCQELRGTDGSVRHTPAELALEEGLAENWAQQNVHHVIQALNLDVRYPELLMQRSVDAYPALQAASTKLVDGVARLSGLPAEDVAQRLQQTRSDERFGVIADLVVEPRSDRITGDRAELRGRLERTLEENFAPVLAVEFDNGDLRAQRGTEIAKTTLAEVSRVLDQAENGEARQESQEPQQQAARTWEEEILAWQREQANAAQQPAQETWEDQVLAWQREQATAAQQPPQQPAGQTFEQVVQAWQHQQPAGQVDGLRKFLDAQRSGPAGGEQAAEGSNPPSAKRNLNPKRGHDRPLE
ncbi:hypothetical protein AB0F43_32385 [Kribbella sp. NPDC023972]|uniref:hypothetical protein n=1 Tax=Kribbella sp. NPDC023972 TaxID=3154795 RepID=UPI0033DED493